MCPPNVLGWENMTRVGSYSLSPQSRPPQPCSPPIPTSLFLWRRWQVRACPRMNLSDLEMQMLLLSLVWMERAGRVGKARAGWNEEIAHLLSTLLHLPFSRMGRRYGTPALSPVAASWMPHCSLFPLLPFPCLPFFPLHISSWFTELLPDLRN